MNPWPFAWVAATWGVVGYALAPSPWHIVLWGLSVLNLFALMMAMRAVFRQSGMVAWGTFKLACFGFLIVMLLEARTAPTFALLTGLATIPVVVLIGASVLCLRNWSDA
jgi:hypothetical protein